MMPVHILKSEHMIRGITFKQFRKREADVRKNLKEVADHLGITIRSYHRIESGELLGSISHWDALEDLFKTHQRKIRTMIGKEQI